MRPDPGREIQLAVIATMDQAARGRERLRLSERERLLAWAQADAAGPTTELERAEFLLRRLHPEMAEASLQQILEQLARAYVDGTWTGFERPAPLD
jgi:hypothetical protein